MQTEKLLYILLEDIGNLGINTLVDISNRIHNEIRNRVLKNSDISNNITIKAECDMYGKLLYPELFIKKISANQITTDDSNMVIMSFKDGYFNIWFEDKRVLKEVSEKTNTDLRNKNVLVGYWTKMEAVVKEFNRIRYYVEIIYDKDIKTSYTQIKMNDKTFY